MTGSGSEEHYSEDFYREIREGSLRSARRVLAVVRDLLGPGPIESVVDVGCGDGSWLVAAADVLSCADILGIDGRHVSAGSTLRIPRERFVPYDLGSDPAALRAIAQRSRDLCLCLEVAEHLPPTGADAFIAALCELAPIVLFSAAIPHQGGKRHVNEQWPSYWVEKFRQHEFEPIDAIRPRVWDDPSVEYWYKQNAILFVARLGRAARPQLGPLIADTAARGVPALVHPDLFLREARGATALRYSRVVRCATLVRGAFSRLTARRARR